MSETKQESIGNPNANKTVFLKPITSEKLAEVVRKTAERKFAIWTSAEYAEEHDWVLGRSKNSLWKFALQTATETALRPQNAQYGGYGYYLAKGTRDEKTGEYTQTPEEEVAQFWEDNAKLALDVDTQDMLAGESKVLDSIAEIPMPQ